MKRRALITGCGGFIGSHLAQHLLPDYEVYGTYHNNTQNLRFLDKVHTLQCDISDKKSVKEIVEVAMPDVVFHLAAQSFVIPSWKDPENTYKTNFLGTMHLFDVLKDSNAVIEVACSSAEYGLSLDNEIPIKENKVFRPSSPYAISKVATDMISYLYWKSFNMKILRLRFFNITGPRKANDACSDFARSVANAKDGDTIKVGNLDGIRDLTDVRDAVKAMLLLLEKGHPGEVYNICTGKGVRMREVLDHLIELSKTEINVEIDKSKFRILDEPIFLGDNSKISSLGWHPDYSLDKTLSDMLEFWRANQ